MKFIIVRTDEGIEYAHRIEEELVRMGHEAINCIYRNLAELLDTNSRHYTAYDTTIHTRAAYPSSEGWMGRLFRLEREDWAVINSPGTLRLTSDKYRCAKTLIEAGIPHPRTEIVSSPAQIRKCLQQWGIYNAMLKPRTSKGNGRHVNKIFADDGDVLDRFLSTMPGDQAVCQEEVPYTALYRVVALAGKALPVVWKDAPTRTRWQVSVCLNPAMTVDRRPAEELLDMAVQAQQVVGGDINFIDIFETPNGFVMGEINTACSLLRHERYSGVNIARKIAETLINLVE